jgi:hypothetical protein
MQRQIGRVNRVQKAQTLIHVNAAQFAPRKVQTVTSSPSSSRSQMRVNGNASIGDTIYQGWRNVVERIGTGIAGVVERGQWNPSLIPDLRVCASIGVTGGACMGCLADARYPYCVAQGKVAVVTGSNTGMGYATALKLAESGAKVGTAAIKSLALSTAVCSSHWQGQAFAFSTKHPEVPFQCSSTQQPVMLATNLASCTHALSCVRSSWSAGTLRMGSSRSSA